MQIRAIGRTAILATLSLLFAASAAHSRDLILVSVDGSPRDSGNNFIDLVDDMLSQEGNFQDLATTPNYTIEVDYLGVARAFRFDAQANGSTVTLTIPSTGFSRVFVGSSADDIQNQLEDFLKEDGASALADFLEEVNGRSPLAVLDGNPRSTTALFSRGAYDRFGFSAPRSRAGNERANVAKWGYFDLQVEANGGLVDVDGFDSLGVVDGALTLAGDFKTGVGLSFSMIGQYRDFDGAEMFDAGVEIGVPVWILAASKDSPIRWVVTPFIQAGAGASIDLAAGGLMMGGGIVNSISYNLGAFEFMMANEIVYYGGIPVNDIGGYDFDTELDRLILKNGGKVAYHLPSGTYVEAGLTFTNFLVNDAAIDFYTTPFVGLGAQLGIVGLRFGWESDLHDDYATQIGKGEISFTF